MTQTTANITQPAQRGMLLFMMATTAGSSMRYEPASPSMTSIRPWKARNRASVTTNEGTPIFATK